MGTVFCTYTYMALMAWLYTEADMMKAQAQLNAIKKMLYLFFTIGAAWLSFILVIVLKEKTPIWLEWLVTLLKGMQAIVLFIIVANEKKIFLKLMKLTEGEGGFVPWGPSVEDFWAP